MDSLTLELLLGFIFLSLIATGGFLVGSLVNDEAGFSCPSQSINIDDECISYGGNIVPKFKEHLSNEQNAGLATGMFLGAGIWVFIISPRI